MNAYSVMKDKVLTDWLILKQFFKHALNLKQEQLCKLAHQQCQSTIDINSNSQ